MLPNTSKYFARVPAWWFAKVHFQMQNKVLHMIMSKVLLLRTNCDPLPAICSAHDKCIDGIHICMKAS